VPPQASASAAASAALFIVVFISAPFFGSDWKRSQIGADYSTCQKSMSNVRGPDGRRQRPCGSVASSLRFLSKNRITR
jgi:hypothetical protein